MPPAIPSETDGSHPDPEARFRALIECGFDLAVELDSQAVVRFASQSIVRILGFHPEDVIGRSLFEFLHPEDSRRARERFASRVEFVGCNGGVEMRVRHADGSWRFLEGVSNYLGSERGATAHLVVNCRDVTERRHALEETRLHRAILECQSEASPDGILVVSEARRILHRNRRFADMWNLPETVLDSATEADVLNWILQQVVNPETFLAGVEELYAPGMEARRDELCLRDGRVIERYSAPLTRDSRHQRGRVWYFRDLTGKRRLESHLLHAQRLESLGTLASGIVHELRNVLSPIQGSASLASLELSADHPAQRHLQSVLEAGKYAYDLLQRILTFSRHDEQPRQLMELGPVVRDALKLLRSTLPRTVDVTARIDSLTPPVLANATQIHQVVMNLGINAWQACGNDGGTLEIKLAAVMFGSDSTELPPGLTPGEYVRLSVRDNGQGMDQAALERIFEPFFTTKPAGQGTGLGLSVVHGIVRNHEATITVQSNPGQGAAFHIYFPMPPPPAVTLKVSAVPMSGWRILYVDDDQPMVELVEHSLRRQGHKVTGYTDPVAALAVFRAEPSAFDLAMADLSMPAMPGLALARELKAIRPDLPVVLVSGCVESEDAERARRLGVARVLEKPGLIDEFNDLLQQILAQSLGRSDQ